MALRIAVQMDPIEDINTAGDSSFALMLSAQERGYEVFEYHVESLTLDAEDRLIAECAPVTVQRVEGDHFTKGEAQRLDLGSDIDVILMRITDIFLAFPRLVLALAFVAALGAGIENAVLAISLTAWPPYARIARAETLTIRSSDYIAAIRLQGAGALRIITRHIWPLCISSLIVRVTLDMAGIILAAAGLGFLGLGAQPPSPEWGAMISEGRRFILDHWWVATVPGDRPMARIP